MLALALVILGTNAEAFEIQQSNYFSVLKITERTLPEQYSYRTGAMEMLLATDHREGVVRSVQINRATPNTYTYRIWNGATGQVYPSFTLNEEQMSVLRRAKISEACPLSLAVNDNGQILSYQKFCNDLSSAN